jgi:hypothetical protein
MSMVKPLAFKSLPPPLQQSFVDARGNVSRPWLDWLYNVYLGWEQQEITAVDDQAQDSGASAVGFLADLISSIHFDTSLAREEAAQELPSDPVFSQEDRNEEQTQALLGRIEALEAQAAQRLNWVDLPLNLQNFIVEITGITVLPKASGIGIKVDVVSPTFGFRDLLGEIKILSPGANDPTLAVFRDSIRAFSFSNAVMNEANFHYHIPHDYVPGSDIFLHFHWSQNVVDSGGPAGVPGDVKWQAECSYAKGHDQAAFPATFTTSTTQTASGTQYQHMLTEVQLSAASPSATEIDSDILEPDGLIILRAFRDPTDVADTLDQVPFLHQVDIHYESTNIATKAKAPDFYT